MSKEEKIRDKIKAEIMCFCECSPGYKDRGLNDPNCHAHYIWESGIVDSLVFGFLSEERRELEGAVKRMIKIKPIGYGRNKNDEKYHKALEESHDISVYNQAVDDILSLLKGE